MIGLDVEDVYPDGKTALPPEYTDLSYMVSNYGPPDSAVQAMREGTRAENVAFYPPDLLQSLRELAARKKFGRDRAPGEWDVIGTEGAQGAIGYAFMTFLNPGEEVIITDPAYMHFASCAVAVGAVPVPVSLNEGNNFRLTAEDVERVITPRSKMLVVCDPINPFGTVQSETSLRELAALCRRHGIVIFNNTTHSGHQIDPGVKHTPMAALHESADVTHVVSASGLSKSHGLAAIRVGFLAGSVPFVKAVASMRMEVTKIHTNYIGQLGAVAALQDPDYTASSTACMRSNAALIASIAENTKGVRQPVVPDYGFSTVIDLSETGVTAQEVCVALFKRKFATIPGDALGDVGASEYLRINYSHRDQSRLETFGDVLPDAISEAQTGVFATPVADFFRKEGTRRGSAIVEGIESRRPRV
jgi:aspartate/methionine/tyrosine aminotransferase